MAKEYDRGEEARYLAEELDDVDDLIPDEKDIPEDSSLLAKIIDKVTWLLAFLLIGASAVLWWILLRALLSDPNTLYNPSQMRTMLISCTLTSVAVFFVQLWRKKSCSIESWLKCMCLAGVITALIVALSFDMFTPKLVNSYTTKSIWPDLFVVLCCSLSGCALPAMICYAIRLIFGKSRMSVHLRERFRRYDLSNPDDAAEWDEVSEDVRALTDFGKNN